LQGSTGNTLGISGSPEDHHGTDDHELLDALSDLHFRCAGTDVAAAMSIDVVWGMPTDVVARGSGLLAWVPGAPTTTIPPGPHST